MEYTHIHPKQSQNSPTKIKYNRLTQRTKGIKNYIYQLRTKLRHKPENKTKARCQVGNKAVKTTNKQVKRKGKKEKKARLDMQS